MPQANNTGPSSLKKRKLQAGGSDRPMKKITSYFQPLHRVTLGLKEKESQAAPLNSEQKKVLEMVVDEGRNLFFTGAAGA
jgi:hypothetical protein